MRGKKWERENLQGKEFLALFSWREKKTKKGIGVENKAVGPTVFFSLQKGEEIGQKLTAVAAAPLRLF